MRYSVLGGALLIGLAILASRPADPATRVIERKVEVPVRVEVPVPVEPPMTQVGEVVNGDRPAQEKPPAPPVYGGHSLPYGAALGRKNMMFLFEREIDLRPDQRRFMEDVLVERDRAIESVQNEIRASGVFQARQYDRQVNALQGASYQKMAQVLAPEQQQRFAELVAQGRIGDSIEFELGPNMMMIQD
jgi:hypothetical protein